MMVASLTVCMYFLVLYVSLFIKITHCHTRICLPDSHNVALFIFGDSLFDAGNNNYIITTTTVQANYPPYGESFFKYPSGRFSDGRLIPDFIAEHAKLPIVPPYLYPGFLRQYVYGVNFASAGAGALVETRRGMVIDLRTQASYFSRVSKLLRKELGDTEAKASISRAVYIFSVGGNDYLVPFLTNSTVVLPYPQQQFVDIVIGNISTVISEIYKEGGRKFGFINLIPLNCAPLLRILRNGSSINECSEKEASALARLHNIALLKMLQNLQKQLKGFKYSLTDLFTATIEVLKNPLKYGFKEGNGACCGGGPYKGDNSCGGKRGIPEYELCENVSEFVFFDSFHFTERVYEHFSQLMWSGSGNATESHSLKSLFKA